MFCFRKHHIKITMRKRIYKRLTAGLLCVVLLFADTTSMMKLRASSIDSDAGQIAALEASGEESATNEEAVIEGGAKEETTEENTEEKAEELPAEKPEEEITESDTTNEPDGKEENIGAETEVPEEVTEEEEQPGEELPKEDISKEEQTEDEEQPEEGTENADQKEEETEEEEQPAEENAEEVSETEGEEVPTAAGDIASGNINEKYGQMSWVIDVDGKLTVRELEIILLRQLSGLLGFNIKILLRVL